MTVLNLKQRLSHLTRAASRAVLAGFIAIFALSSLAQASFSDLSSLHPNYAAISSLVDQEILQGYEDGTFKPDQEVTRAEAVKIILLGMGILEDTQSVAGLLFTDVNKDDWFSGYVGTAVGSGIIQGYDDGTFMPHQTVNRAEAMKILLLAAGVDVEAPSVSPFLDADSQAWFAGYADYAKTWNIQPPQTDGLWHPEEEVTRANISEMVYRMQSVQDTGESFDEFVNWLEKDFTTVDVSLKIPFGWSYKQDGVGAAWLLDTDNGQMSLLTPYDNGGTLLMTRYLNPENLSANSLFNKLRAATIYENAQASINGYDALIIYHETDTYFREWYIMMDNGTLVHFLALRGNGAYSSYLENYLETIVSTVQYAPDGVVEMSIDDILESLRSAVQVDGAGAEVMALLDDLELIETDTIGVGTGPVDYYYSPSANVTVKYERSFDVILDIENGETTSF